MPLQGDLKKEDDAAWAASRVVCRGVGFCKSEIVDPYSYIILRIILEKYVGLISPYLLYRFTAWSMPKL